MVEIVHRRQTGPIPDQGPHVCHQIEPFRVSDFQAAEEGLDRGQTRIASPHAIVPVRLEVIEKGEQRGGVEMPDFELAEPVLVTLRGEDHQQCEAAGAACDGMGAAAAITLEPLSEEGQQWP